MEPITKFVSPTADASKEADGQPIAVDLTAHQSVSEKRSAPKA